VVWKNAGNDEESRVALHGTSSDEPLLVSADMTGRVC
jgi:hypothetical protein